MAELDLMFTCDECGRKDLNKLVKFDLDGWEAKGLEHRIRGVTNKDPSVRMRCPACVYEASKEAQVQNAQRVNSELMNKGVSVTQRIDILSRDFPELNYDLEIS